MNFTIEPMTIDDYEEVARLWQSAEGVGLSESDSREGVNGYLARNPGLSLIARLPGGRLVAAVLAGHDGRRGFLYHLAVAADCRRRGIAKALLGACLAGLAARGILKCTIVVYTHNPEGRQFWTHNGWSHRADLCVLQTPLPPVGGGCQQ